MPKPTPAICNKAEKVLKKFLAEIDKEFIGDARIYTHQQWNTRGETCGKNASATLVLDGSPLYEIFNEYFDRSTVFKKFESLLKENGFYYELGYAWSIHLYEVHVFSFKPFSVQITKDPENSDNNTLTFKGMSEEQLKAIRAAFWYFSESGKINKAEAETINDLNHAMDIAGV